MRSKSGKLHRNIRFAGFIRTSLGLADVNETVNNALIVARPRAGRPDESRGIQQSPCFAREHSALT
jgi:hypothetical protein